MSGSLIHIASATTSSNVDTLDIGGSAWDDSYNVYKVVVDNLQSDQTSDIRLKCRILKSDNSADATSEYDNALKGFRSDTGVDDIADNNGTYWSNITYIFRGSTSHGANATMYLFNFNESSEYNYVTIDGVGFGYDGTDLMGACGGGVHTVGQVAIGLQFLIATDGSEHISNANINLYGLRK